MENNISVNKRSGYLESYHISQSAKKSKVSSSETVDVIGNDCYELDKKECNEIQKVEGTSDLNNTNSMTSSSREDESIEKEVSFDKFDICCKIPDENDDDNNSYTVIDKNKIQEPNTTKRQSKHDDVDRSMSICSQIEYYMSDENLKHDSFFNNILRKSKNRLNISYILSCKKIKKFNTNEKEIIDSLKYSDITIVTDTKTGSVFLQRNGPLPKLESLPLFLNNKNIKIPMSIVFIPEDINVLGCFLKVLKIPENIDWTIIRRAIRQISPKECYVTYISPMNDLRVSYVYIKSFANDIELYSNLKSIKVDSYDIPVELVQFVTEANYLIKNVIPPFSLKERERIFKRYRAGILGNEIVVAGVPFENYNHLRLSIYEYLWNTPVDVELSNPTLSVILELLAHHPEASKKMRDLKSIIIKNREDLGKNKYDRYARAFFVVRNDETIEDFSINKCYEKFINLKTYNKIKAN